MVALNLSENNEGQEWIFIVEMTVTRSGKLGKRFRRRGHVPDTPRRDYVCGSNENGVSGGTSNLSFETDNLPIHWAETSEIPEMRELVAEYHREQPENRERDGLAECLQADVELRTCVKRLIRHRGKVQRVLGYLDRFEDEEDEKGNASQRVG